ncbi:MAG TPA: alpha/beta fold hydrolase [Saprospiraceae bacterium]|nr:alpha/beta fold hydrolase [Saprospiraceae bacterium]
MKHTINKESNFTFIETMPDYEGAPLMLLHGLMGALSNFETILDEFGSKRNVVVPLLPIFEMPLRSVNLEGLVEYVHSFIVHKGYSKVHLLGNSLGGHICQLVALQYPELVSSVTLTGSSGLFESAMGNSFPKRGDRDFIKRKTEMVFYDPKCATDELIDEVYNTVNDLGKAIRIVKTAKSAVRHNLEDKLHTINLPVLLIWGKNDEVTPAWVGEKFHELLPNSELHIFDECGHVPMMEHAEKFNFLLDQFLVKHS